jgi:hypothetical protein
LARPIIKADKSPTITSDFIGVLLVRSLSQAARQQAPRPAAVNGGPGSTDVVRAHVSGLDRKAIDFAYTTKA